MEMYVVLNLNCQIPRFQSRFPPPTSYRRRRHRNGHRQYNYFMSLSHFAIRRILTTPYHSTFKHRNGNSFCSFPFNVSTMADGSANKSISAEVMELKNGDRSQIKETKDKSLENSTPSVAPPPPPEKPLPGDCCGSGCVRCVWDVYYEELDDYERLYKTDSKASTN